MTPLPFNLGTFRYIATLCELDNPAFQSVQMEASGHCIWPILHEIPPQKKKATKRVENNCHNRNVAATINFSERVEGTQPYLQYEIIRGFAFGNSSNISRGEDIVYMGNLSITFGVGGLAVSHDGLADKPAVFIASRLPNRSSSITSSK
jgi:hypothetical protein